jgi:hypothetical protein
MEFTLQHMWLPNPRKINLYLRKDHKNQQVGTHTLSGRHLLPWYDTYDNMLSLLWRLKKLHTQFKMNDISFKTHNIFTPSLIYFSHTYTNTSRCNTLGNPHIKKSDLLWPLLSTLCKRINIFNYNYNIIFLVENNSCIVFNGFLE